jgi:phosphoenolpyruvate carboxykinase (ATP)
LYLIKNKINIDMVDTNTKSISLNSLGIKNAKIRYQLTSSELHEETLKKEQGVASSLGAIAVNTGEFTGRSPKDRFIVKDAITKDEVWWSDINLPFDSAKFDALYNKVTAYLSEKEIFVRDSYACADENYKLSIRVVNEYPWSNMFAYNMFLRPTEVELKGFHPEWTVINAPGFMADPEVDGTRQHNFAILNFTRKIALIGGTGYTGEIKKGIFSALNFILPVYKKTLPMHCSANVGKQGDTAIFFGLSGTGKTTLSTDPDRSLIGDDEHGWTEENTVFNFEGGCYAKVINLSQEQEPEIFAAIKKGAILENVVLDKEGVIDFGDTSITQNTRVAGTEAGVTEPTPSFSACFGAPFMPLHPTKYAEMLSKKMQETGVNVWLINTGWSGGQYGVGKRMPLKYTRAMISAVLNGDLGSYKYEDYHIHSVFGVAQPRTCPGVPAELLSPRATWNNDEAYYKTAFKLSNAFRENFMQFEEVASEDIRRGGPQRFAL